MTLDEAIEHAKQVARTCEDGQCAAEHIQLAEWLRTARGAEAAGRWYTAKVRELEAESAKLRDELDQWHRLTAGIELPEYPITEFQPKDLERENAKLRVERDEWHRVAMSKQDIIDHMRNANADNAKLRELVDAWMGCGTRYHTMQGGCPMFDADAEDFCKASSIASELGIEVEP